MSVSCNTSSTQKGASFIQAALTNTAGPAFAWGGLHFFFLQHCRLHPWLPWMFTLTGTNHTFSSLYRTALTSIFRLLWDIRNLPKDSLLLCIPVSITTGQIKTLMQLVRTKWNSPPNHPTEKKFVETKQSLYISKASMYNSEVKAVPCSRRQDSL